MKNSLNGSVVTSLQECTDVNITPGAGEDGKVVTYDHASAKFVLAAASGGISKIEDADDVNVTLGAGEDEKALCYDHDTAKFVLRQVTIGACLLSSGATVGAASQAQAFTNGVKTGYVFPAADATTGFQIRKANASTNVFNVDTTNARVGINLNNPNVDFVVQASAHGGGIQLKQSADQAGIYLTFVDHDTFTTSLASFDTNYHVAAYANSFLFGLRNGKDFQVATSATSDLGAGAARLVVKNSGLVGIGTNPVPGTQLDIDLVDAVTYSISNVLTVRHASAGTPAAGFGSGLRFGLESSTTENQDAAIIEALWNEATHASRKADLVLSVYDTAKREGLRMRGAGSAPAIGFLGATPAARIAHVADAVTAHAVTDPGDSPADADALRDDLVTNVIPSMETQLNNLGTVINSILSTLETFGFHATS